MIRKEAVEHLWRLGVIAPWYLYDHQLSVYEFVRSVHDPFFEATRRFGKTTTFLVKMQEDSRQQQGRVVRWCEPWKEQARNIVMPEMELIQASCPSKLRAKFYRTDSFYEFPTTGSRLYLLGVNEDKGEQARGSFAHEIVADELGSWTDPEYILNEVLRPQLLTTRGSLPQMSTPPDNLDHYWYRAKEKALIEGRFIQRTIDDVKHISDPEKERFIESMGGRQSTAVRRELYCEPVADPEKVVIPEYDPAIHDLDDDAPRPQHFDAYVGIDLGFADCTALLFGYYDFLNATLVIEDEWVGNGKNSKEITNGARLIEERLWGTKACDCQRQDTFCGTHGIQPYLRIADNDLQQLYDMQTLCKYSVFPTRKDDKHSAINALRLRFKDGKIKIKKRCVVLRHQLKTGMWNERKTDLVRTEKGHLDCIPALVYLNRNVNLSRNPYPQNVGISVYSHLVDPSTVSPMKPEDRAIAAAFGL